MLLRVLTFIMLFFASELFASESADRWQQAVKYEIEIDFDDKKHQYSGRQRIWYRNNSPDTLTKLFFHLYNNAFQPNSMMDVRSRTIADPDSRVGDRIFKLKPEDQGYLHVNSLEINERKVSAEEVGTILEVTLATPILPETETTIELTFEGQVPEQIRRNGKNNEEGIDYSMAQWYPKLCEYDYQGWHAHPYVGREFYGVWGDFDVRIALDSRFTVAATGTLQNAEEIGHGYATLDRKQAGKLTWHFKAEKVHDFVWAADAEYTHTSLQAEDGTLMRFFYVNNEKTEDSWSRLPSIMSRVFEIIGTRFGKYPYPEYSFIQAGDGGMEYPMATLITGHRSLPSLVGVSVHELVHSWYQMILGTNESLYAWMDEGFTSYVSSLVMNELRREGLLPGEARDNPHASAYRGYINFSLSGFEEPMSTHADHFITNQAYSVSSYVKGAVFLGQLKYIIGEDAFSEGMKRYFHVWKFKHPNVNDFVRVMEKVSGLELDWYKEYWVNTTHQIDYSVDTLVKSKKNTEIVLRKKGTMPMPLEVAVTLTSGETTTYSIPLRIMRGNKPVTAGVVLAEDWPWTHPTYRLTVPVNPDKIAKVEIDPNNGMADVNPANNRYLSSSESE